MLRNALRLFLIELARTGNNILADGVTYAGPQGRRHGKSADKESASKL